MSIDGVNNYQSMMGVGGSTTSKKAGDGLNMDDFLSLLVAQMSNQDMYNTMDDSQFMAQMAQFSMIQAISELSQMSTTSYSVSLIGKEVTIAESQPNGQIMSFSGIVEGVTLFNGSSQIVVEGRQYPLSSVMEVFQPSMIIPDAIVNTEAVQETEKIIETQTTGENTEAIEDVTESSETEGEAGGDV